MYPPVYTWRSHVSITHSVYEPDIPYCITDRAMQFIRYDDSESVFTVVSAFRLIVFLREYRSGKKKEIRESGVGDRECVIRQFMIMPGNLRRYTKQCFAIHRVVCVSCCSTLRCKRGNGKGKICHTHGIATLSGSMYCYLIMHTGPRNLYINLTRRV